MIFTFTNDADVMEELSMDCFQQDLNCKFPKTLKGKLRSLYLYQQIEGDDEVGCTATLLLRGASVEDSIQSDLICYEMEDGIETANLTVTGNVINLTLIATNIAPVIKVLESLNDHIVQAICSIDIRVKVQDSTMLIDKLITKNYLDIYREHPVISSGSYILSLNHKLEDDIFYSYIANILCKCMAGVNEQVLLEFELDMDKMLTTLNALTGEVIVEKDILPYLSRK